VTLRFGPFTLVGHTRQLFCDGAERHLSPKAFDLLWNLVEHRPRVVEKAALLTRIWPDTYVVDANLNVVIGEIRRALGDSAREPRFIRTVHGIGYAFCGPATESEPAARPGSGRVTPCWVVATEGTFRLAEGENIVGRDPECAVWLDADSVSRRHARIVVDSANRRVVLDDLASKNGTRVRGGSVRDRVELSDGDELIFGAVKVKLRSWNAATDAETRRISRPESDGPPGARGLRPCRD
jgi:DNA-binding winged helix-turn-helix (wHTH) protein